MGCIELFPQPKGGLRCAAFFPSLVRSPWYFFWRVQNCQRRRRMHIYRILHPKTLEYTSTICSMRGIQFTFMYLLTLVWLGSLTALQSASTSLDADVDASCLSCPGTPDGPVDRSRPVIHSSFLMNILVYDLWLVTLNCFQKNQFIPVSLHSVFFIGDSLKMSLECLLNFSRIFLGLSLKVSLSKTK